MSRVMSSTSHNSAGMSIVLTTLLVGFCIKFFKNRRNQNCANSMPVMEVEEPLLPEERSRIRSCWNLSPLPSNPQWKRTLVLAVFLLLFLIYMSIIMSVEGTPPKTLKVALQQKQDFGNDNAGWPALKFPFKKAHKSPNGPLILFSPSPQDEKISHVSTPPTPQSLQQEPQTLAKMKKMHPKNKKKLKNIKKRKMLIQSAALTVSSPHPSPPHSDMIQSTPPSVKEQPSAEPLEDISSPTQANYEPPSTLGVKDASSVVGLFESTPPTDN